MPVRDRRVLYPPCTGLRSLPRFPQFVCPPDNGLETRLRPLKLSGALSRSSTGQQTQSMRSYASKRKSKDRSSRSVDSPQRVSTSVQGTSSHAHEGSSGIAPSLHRSPKPSQVSSVRPSTGQRTGDQTASSKLSRASSRSSTGQRTQSDSQLVLATDHQASATDKSAMSSHRTPDTGHRPPATFGFEARFSREA